VDARGLDGFVEGHRRDEAGDTFCEHGFAATGGSHQEKVVSATHSHFHGPASEVLSADIRKVGSGCGRGLGEEFIWV
jgi:alpha/beta superfamily hydrolase